jgi:hypothetical protein
LRLNSKQKPYFYFGLACSVAVGILVAAFPEAVNSNPVLKAITFMLFIPTAVFCCWVTAEIVFGPK